MKQSGRISKSTAGETSYLRPQLLVKHPARARSEPQVQLSQDKQLEPRKKCMLQEQLSDACSIDSNPTSTAQKALVLFPAENRTAVFSEDRRYRYTLRILWDDSKPLVQFIGLNPSTADEVKDDNTVRRCKRFAQRWNYGGIIMTNIFAFRSTDPRPMKAHPNPIGELGTFTLGRRRFTNRNDYYLALSRSEATECIAAWGNHGLHLGRSAAVLKLLDSLKCFRITKAKQPEHPLYMPYSISLLDYS